MTELYPLKFEPILMDKIWGGNALAGRWGKNADLSRKIGESWELSAVPENLSVVSNGFLAGNNIQEIIEVYMGDITGEAIFDRYGLEFPLLIKLIEADKDLSIQVHPGDDLAMERHGAFGKTEMWYILESLPGAKIYTGFSRQESRESFSEALLSGKLPGMLNIEESTSGDVFFTPAGRIHAIGEGNLLVEIQQTSDITYRIFDWDRKNTDGSERELHTELSLDAIDYSPAGNTVIRKELITDSTVNLVSCDYFVTNILHFSSIIRKDYNLIDSFIIYICTEGEFLIHWDSGTEIVKKGETVLLPAMITDVVLEPRPESKVLEVFINSYPDIK
ncbi:MAG: type I phosphomannose isomerase catalytic subunit [Bacteroidales bacterium]|jgi:mannose-6-phosphate isomerase